MGSFFQNIGLAVGRNMTVGQEFAQGQADLESRRQQTEASKQTVEMNKMQMMMQKSQLETRKQLGQQIADIQAQDKGSVQDPEASAKLYQSAAMSAMSKGDFTSAKELEGLAKSERDAAKVARVEVESKIGAAKETLAKAAINFSTAPTPEGQNAVAKAAVAAGVNPMDIPPPNSPAFKAWAKAQETGTMSSEKQLTAKEKVREFDLKEEEIKRTHEATEQDRRERRADRAVAQQGNKILANSFREQREDRLKKEGQFKETETLNKSLNRAAAPYVKDRELLTSVRNFLSQSSPEADQQVRQLLPSLVSNAKGRATHDFYKDNKNFGSLVSRVEGFLSRATSGKYSEVNRKELESMLNSMQNEVIDPTITRLEENQKEKAKRFEIDPENIAVEADFNRKQPKAASTVPPPTPGGAAAKNTGRTGGSMVKPEVTKSIDGVDYYQKDGKWFKK